MDQSAKRTHIVLLGDSIFDNGTYVRGQLDVVRQLQALLVTEERATLLAVDGAVTDGVADQARSIPRDATLLVVSAGGNDALRASTVLQNRATSVGDAVMQLAQAQARFRERYEAMVDTVTAAERRTALCTIYDANYPGQQGVIVRAALALFNDVITRAAFARGLAVLDLRLICNDAADYANPIEPSAAGGAKIASAIARLGAAALTDECYSVVVAR